MRQAAKIADSLRVLPLVRREADSLAVAVRAFRQAADSLALASTRNLRAFRSKSVAYDQQSELLTAAKFDTDAWRRKARHRGLLNWLGAAATAGAGYFFLFK